MYKLFYSRSITHGTRIRANPSMNSNVLLQIGFAFGTFSYKWKKKLRKQKWNLTDNTQNRNYHSKGTRKGARWWHAFLRAHSMCNDLQMRRHICGTLGHEFRNVTWHDFLRQFPSWPKKCNVNHQWRWKFTTWNIKPKWGKISKLVETNGCVPSCRKYDKRIHLHLHEAYCCELFVGLYLETGNHSTLKHFEIYSVISSSGSSN